jgi:hypothetical protein
VKIPERDMARILSHLDGEIGRLSKQHPRSLAPHGRSLRRAGNARRQSSRH